MTAPLGVITGAAGGIGAALVRRLAKAGWRQHLIDPNDAGVRLLADEVGGTFTSSALATPEACKTALPDTPITALVHLAGIFVPDHMPPGDRGIYDEALQVNATSAYDIVGAAAERISDGGRIVLAASLAFNRGGADHVAYSMAKGAIVGLTRALSRKLGTRGITVNAVAPGVIETRMTDDLIAARGRDNILATVPLGRLGTAEDVAGVIAFLMSSDAGYITGQLINVDGGIVNG